MRFLVAVGSLHEADDERGLAHFVEHMAFRGTRQYPNGTMAAELQRRGIAFGPDSTAFTHFDHTIYHLDLPEVSEGALRYGLAIFREYAEAVTFAPELIERERGVIISEKNIRDTPDARTSQINLEFLWPESRQAKRSPIGLEASIRTFTREQFVAFYDAWYRPERMAVIVVGDVDTAMVERLIGEVLTPVSARGPTREAPATFVPQTASSPNILIHTDPGLIGASCSLEHPLAEPHVDDTHAHRAKMLHRSLAFAMFQRRISKAASDSEGPSISPSASFDTPVPGWSVSTFGSTGKIDNWREFMTDVEQQHRRAFLYGFTEAELKAAKTAFATNFAEAVRTSATWPSGWLAERLADCILEGEVFSTPVLRQHDLSADLEAATPAMCLTAFRQAWTQASPHVFIATNPEFKVTANEIADALNASRLVATSAPVESPTPEFGYVDFGTPGETTGEHHLADLDIDQTEFANGVRLNFKPTTFEADTVYLCVRIGTGKLSQPESKPGLDLLANELVPRGGLQRHSFEEIQDVLSGHTIHVNFNVRSDAFEFGGRCARQDLLLCLQMITAQLTDAAYRPEARRQVNAVFGSFFAKLAASASGPISVFSERTMAGDRRFGLPTPDELLARTTEELKAWIEPEFKHGAIELSIVGDTTWSEAKRAVAQTLAALPVRKSPDTRRSQPIQAGKPRKSMYVFTTAPQLRQVALSWLCPVPDLGDVRRERRCRLLAELMSEHLRVRLREELGAAYVFNADFVYLDGFPALSYFSIYTEVAPNHAQQAARLVGNELEALRKKKFTDDEFQRVKQPFLKQREQDLRENTYWAYTVLRDAQQRPERIAAARSRAADTAAITRAEVEALASRYFNPKRYFQFVAYPSQPAQSVPSFGHSALPERSATR
jgi:zinc protease